VRPLAITGLGVVSSLGIGWDAFRDAYAHAAEGNFSSSPETVPREPCAALRVAEVAGFDAKKYVGDKGLRANDRLTKLSLVAARLGLEHAGLKRDGAFTGAGPDDVGVVASTAYGSTEAIAENNRIAKLEDPRYLNPARFPNTVINSAFGYVSIWEDLRALNVTVTNGPTGALDAVSCAGVYLEAGRAKAILAGGAEASSELLWDSLNRVGALHDTAAWEWDGSNVRGTGTRLGEAAALLALELPEVARARGARVWGEVVGYGSAFDVADDQRNLVAPSTRALCLAIEEALRDAGLTAGDVDVVFTGLSWIPDLHESELFALSGMLPEVPRSAPKKRQGETLGASGAMALACACACFDGAPVREVIRGAVPAQVRVAVITAMGFYGNASALVVRRAE
jgi:3-oxoacyl-[acyl-carrier-protein] synthase II